MNIKLLTIVAIAALLAGCGTTPIRNDDATSMPVDARFLRKTANSGMVTIKRDGGHVGACANEVYVNAQVIGEIDTAEKLVIYLPADDYIFGVGPTGICIGEILELNGSVKAGKELTLRIGYNHKGELFFNQTAFK